MLIKWLSTALCLLLLLPSAQAAQLLEVEQSHISNAFTPTHVYALTGQEPELLLDNDPYTCWSRSANVEGSSCDLTLYTNQPTLAALWIRNGNQGSQWAYTAYGRPAIIKLDISHLVYDVLHTNTYRYAMTDVYQPDVDSLMWQNGYQCLQLPTTITGVQSISLTVESALPGSYQDTVCISDILLASAPPTLDFITPQQPSAAPIETKLLMRMATRSGPSTRYEELGSYFKEGSPITAISLCYDDGGVPWVQVEFTYQNRLRRAYTGLKRVDVDEALLPQEEILSTATLLREVAPRFGPGINYAARNLSLPAGLTGTVYAHENNWAQFEYFDEEKQLYRRVWIPDNDLLTY